MKDFFGNPEQLEELAAYMASQINVPTIGIGGGYAPIGSINFFDATTAPQDWLACDGTVYKIADYPQLADWYEAQHGSKNFYGGDGTTTFAVPDLQGEFLRGTGTNSHTNQGNGAAVGEHQDGTSLPLVAAFDNYVCVYRNTDKSNNGPLDVDAMVLSSGNGNRINAATVNADFPGSRPVTITSRPTNTSFLICVKAVVAGEVYSTEERVVGTWIDGKPVYEKVITTKTSAVLNEEVFAPIGADVEYGHIVSGSIYDGTGIYLSIPITNKNFTGYIRACIRNNIASAHANTVTINTTIQEWINKDVYIIIQYTKTTD